MKITNNLDKLELVIQDEERSEWKKGNDVFYSIKKDYRPYFNYFEYFDDSHKPIIKLEELMGTFTNKGLPENVREVLKNAEIIADLHEKYMSHTLAVCLEYLYKDYLYEIKNDVK